MGYSQNDLITNAWKRFRILHRGEISPVAFLIGDTLYEYASKLSSNNTILLSNYFVYEYKKYKIANDVGVSADSLRKKTKGRNGTVWDELHRIGFIINSKNHLKVKTLNSVKETDFYMSTKVAIPLFVEELANEKDLVNLGYFYKKVFGKEKTLKYINNLEEKINGTYETNVVKKVSTVDFTKENINNYTLFEKDTEKVKRAKLCFKFFCLLGRSGIDVQKNIEESFKFFNMFIHHCFKENQGGNLGYIEIEKTVQKVYNYSKRGDNMQTIYGQLNKFFQTDMISELAREFGISEQALKESSLEEKRKQTESRLTKENKKKLEVLEGTLKNEPVDIQINILKDKINEYYLDSIKFEDYHYQTRLFSLLSAAESKSQENERSDEFYEEYLEYGDREDFEQLLFEAN
ncbi:hypothetical protein AAEO50_07380 [Rossellomorea oryzaecorticis]|uniref:Uncharacterized protein n=1 Tax=Rossellomorea oryzaecorticis TaxID=1396505 RepID=A0ABU9K8K1_9BACI